MLCAHIIEMEARMTFEAGSPQVFSAPISLTPAFDVIEILPPSATVAAACS
jgi:hypothetical protein